jgi:hypothetical protein
VVSSVSITVKGVTTTTISYSDGTTDVETSGSPTTTGSAKNSNNSSQAPQTYNAKGTITGGTAGTGATSSASQAVAS